MSAFEVLTHSTLTVFLNTRWAWALVVALGSLLVGVGVLLAVWRPLNISGLTPSFFFALETIYLLVLLLAAILYLSNFFGIKDEVPWLIAGLLPLGVPWFGALGGVVISLQGVFEFSGPGRWDPTYNHWHMLRPLFASVVAVVGFLLFLVILNAASTPPPFLAPNGTSTALDLVIYYALAFLLGYREATFRELIKRVTDIILQPGSPAMVATAPPIQFRINGAAATQYDFGTVAVGAAPTVDIEVANTTTTAIRAPNVSLVSRGMAGILDLTILNDEVGGVDLDPGEVRTVRVGFAPQAAGERAGLLVVTSADLSAPASIPITART